MKCAEIVFTPSQNMELVYIKVIALFILLAFTYAFGTLPVLVLAILKKQLNLSKLHYCISLMNCLAGGVFLGTSILGLIMESIEIIKNSGIAEGYEALPGVLIGAGFFLVLFLEHIIGKYGEKETHLFHGHGATEAGSKSEISKVSKTSNKGYYGSTSTVEYKDTNLDDNNVEKPEIHNNYESIEKKEDVMSISKELSTDVLRVREKGEARTTRHFDGVKAKLRSLTLLVALSIHMLFEGMAVGLQTTEMDIWTLLAALSVHKCVIAFSVGLKMKETMTNVKLFITMFLFSSVSPVGVAIAIGISSCNGCENAKEISSGVLQSIAAGVFLYVTFFEILQKELAHKYSLLKVFLCFIGFGIMSVLKYFE